jgi:hypothetical protein
MILLVAASELYLLDRVTDGVPDGDAVVSHAVALRSAAHRTGDVCCAGPPAGPASTPRPERVSDVAIRPMRAKTQPLRSKCLLAQVLTRKRVIPRTTRWVRTGTRAR